MVKLITKSLLSTSLVKHCQSGKLLASRIALWPSKIRQTLKRSERHYPGSRGFLLPFSESNVSRELWRKRVARFDCRGNFCPLVAGSRDQSRTQLFMSRMGFFGVRFIFKSLYSAFPLRWISNGA